MKKAFVVLAATLSISSAFAQTASAPAAPATAASPAAAGAHREQRVEQRIAQLHSALKITPAQESQWNTFADVMRSNSQTMMQLVQQREASGAQRSALDDMKQYAQISQAHADGMQKLVAAFEPVYSSLSPEQKTLADKAFRDHEHHGGRTGRKHRSGKPQTPAAESGGQ
ncbi:MAG TPA: Spy/CpxP family protein refolding chaperone [Paraburkholderia sp.]|jgi:protein CpxP|nr:Spy/CpxP family protein refolding chaperone [Paraburkholderia sp.]